MALKQIGPIPAIRCMGSIDFADTAYTQDQPFQFADNDRQIHSRNPNNQIGRSESKYVPIRRFFTPVAKDVSNG